MVKQGVLPGSVEATGDLPLGKRWEPRQGSESVEPVRRVIANRREGVRERKIAIELNPVRLKPT